MHHKLIILSISFFILAVQLGAQETTEQTKELNILITQIKNSSSDDRRIAINKLKIKLRKMNKEIRRKIMLDLQESFAAKSTSVQKSRNSSDIQNSMQLHMQLQQRGGHGSMRNRQGGTHR
ncbi:MAG TPA: hypothetical protein EYH01_00365 [Campylobacterales bacterium]|nr:hypothetical protein [Campylobacterales bacterium]